MPAGFLEISPSIIRTVFPQRNPDAHKNDFGNLLIIGGSGKYSGSSALSAMAAYRSGVDLVTLVAPRRAADIVASFSPDIVTCPVNGDFFTLEHLAEVKELIQDKTAVLIGGGMGRRAETLEFIKQVLTQEHLPIVIDADAIYAVVGCHELVKEEKFVLTPHAYEFQVLTEEIPPVELEAKVPLVQKWAVELTSTIVLKGAEDVISDGQQTVINTTGNPFMTVGGTGDTLAGILAALLAQGTEEFAAACAAAYINGAAGDLAAAQMGPSVIASDLLGFIPQVIMEVLAV
ncbi:NAD(P)H-hydrate dehydratase [Patescibacteria group bacterium]|nr:NAD(P)H-hydrate dehydratase [Patescibacteria group bacterium]